LDLRVKRVKQVQLVMMARRVTEDCPGSRGQQGNLDPRDFLDSMVRQVRTV
jgi:hypothetical protein